MKSIEALPPGLYGMQILEITGGRRQAGLRRGIHRAPAGGHRRAPEPLQRADEKPFEAVAGISEFNQRAYELFAQPLVQASANEYGAKLGRDLHPLRAQRCVGLRREPLAVVVGPGRRVGACATPDRQPRSGLAQERAHGLRIAECIARLLPRPARRHERGRVLPRIRQPVLALPGRPRGAQRPAHRARPPIRANCPSWPRRSPRSSKAATRRRVARVCALLARRGEPLPLSRVQLKHELVEEYKDLLPDIPWELARRIRGEQEIIVRYEPSRRSRRCRRCSRTRPTAARLLALLERLRRRSTRAGALAYAGAGCDAGAHSRRARRASRPGRLAASA